MIVTLVQAGIEAVADIVTIILTLRKTRSHLRANPTLNSQINDVGRQRGRGYFAMSAFLLQDGACMLDSCLGISTSDIRISWDTGTFLIAWVPLIVFTCCRITHCADDIVSRS